jgi:protein transport protein SEC24
MPYLVCCHPRLLAAAAQVYHYPGFHQARDGRKLAAELTRNLTRPTAWEAVMRIRCSRGLKIGSFHGHFFNRR